ncbi:sigma-70 family RNA polymerase sigma factor [Methylophaga nitratireducenticrescens]|uniref:RNA polymerase n=1 Tax=Methylophaga nitratireducenticrescens TaxID=754476 RepID=I1XF92_METNJ|nr:sigma-70 family RNA polymerase sigma factor [Methylophaga nitratireducenticrescens]AFI83061.1 RNA polymerase subunit sigma [Methylophaga nitratireducenticrescens]AUZ83210.1 RNA polymerase subunit sigma [Methylophaga nitratireducenticrescens]
MPPTQLETIYKDHHNWLRGWLYQKVGCDQRAADLAQDTFVRLLQAQHKQTDFTPEQPRAYLRTVANGLVIDYFRRRSLENAYQNALANMPEITMISEEERLLIRETLEQLDALINRLPARVKTIFLLSQLEGLTYAQIAKLTDVSLSTVKRDMQQAFIHCLTLLW